MKLVPIVSFVALILLGVVAAKLLGGGINTGDILAPSRYPNECLDAPGQFLGYEIEYSGKGEQLYLGTVKAMEVREDTPFNLDVLIVDSHLRNEDVDFFIVNHGAVMEYAGVKPKGNYQTLCVIPACADIDRSMHAAREDGFIRLRGHEITQISKEGNTVWEGGECTCVFATDFKIG